mmetsp:Transcript_35410/g.106996  ORF Transcript_35410/g.106996 Transcript_35410/m.106996 type:complete len:253 (+) Transcript_35410:250-1008(+)
MSLNAFSDGRTTSGSMPTLRSCARMLSAMSKSFWRFAFTQRSNSASVSAACLAAAAAGVSGGRTTSGSMPTARSSARRASAMSQFLSRFATTHWSNFSSVSMSNLECGPGASLPGGRRMSGSSPRARRSARIASAVVKSFSRFALTQSSSLAWTCGDVSSSSIRRCCSMRSHSGGLALSGSMPCSRSSARMASAVAKSLSRLAATHLSSLASTPGSCKARAVLDEAECLDEGLDAGYAATGATTCCGTGWND